ncbi:MAG: ribosome small subunit-dependent GTPase A [Clostridia bacterium]|nr:ribosome small subunit-dependent GTPase A [Clostridia bacterium]
MKDINTLSGTIIKGVGGMYSVLTEDIPSVPFEERIINCRARGVFRHESITPLPGDKVILKKEGDTTDFIIDEIADRTSSLVRPAMANLTHIFIVIPAAKPKPDLLTADKLIAAAEGKDIEPVIIITKSDIDDSEAAHLSELYEKSGFSVFCVSAVTGDGTENVAKYIADNAEGMIAAFAGASGAGKSTLMTRLFPDLKLKTGEISRKTERGRHTTRHAELYPFKAGEGVCLIADTPGFSMLDYTRFYFFDPEELPYCFREFKKYIGTCKYTKCTHTKEEGCEILASMKRGEFDRLRHESYLYILEEIKKKPQWKRKQEERV